MSLGNQKANGSEYLPAYQISALPYIKRLHRSTDFTLGASNDVAKISFPYVTSWIYVRSLSTTAASNTEIGFTLSGMDNNKVLKFDQQLLSEKTMENADPVLRVRCKELYLRVAGSGGTDDGAEVEVFVGLTNIPAANFQFDMSSLYS